MHDSRKSLLLVAILLIKLNALVYGQNEEVLLDSRDGKEYSTTIINGTVWMLENLDLETELSYSVPDSMRSKLPDFRGRWYHMSELDDLCPKGWQLPSVDDWIKYFDHLADMSGGSYALETWKADYHLNKFKEYIDLFDEKSPLKINAAGIFEGNRFLYSDKSADFWIQDPTTRKEAGADAYKLVRKKYPGTGHIHLFNEYTQIHSHDHHLDPEKPEEMRRFLCRCVKKK